MPARRKDTRVSPCNMWTGTLNNWTEEEYKFIVDQVDTVPDMEWVIGKEVGDEGTPHLQMCFRRTAPGATGKPIKWRPLPLLKVGNQGRIHFEKMKMGWLTNCKYCAKDGDYRTSSGLDIDKLELRTMTDQQLSNELEIRREASKEADAHQWLEEGQPSYEERILPPAEPEYGLYCLVEEEISRRTALRPTRDLFVPETEFRFDGENDLSRAIRNLGLD